MSRAVFGSLLLLALAVALVLRLSDLGGRPMHHDEANQAVKFGLLLETGDYHYDRTDHHGPTLYYLTLPLAWLRGQATLASLDERTVRLAPAIFGVGLILLLPLLAPHLGRPAVAAAACLTALSPAVTYYSRFYIQETLFVFFVMAAVVAFGRWVERPRVSSAALAGLFGGLSYATKETAVLVAASAIVAAAVARRSLRPRGTGAGHAPPGELRARVRQLALAALVALVTAWMFYTSFFRHPDGFWESILAYGVYLERGVGTNAHAQPWFHYLGLLAYSSSGDLVWSEAAILALAAVGLMAAARKQAGFWPRYVALYALLATVLFSAIRYKTPWNLLPFYAGLLVVAGLGTAAVLGWARSWPTRGLLAVLLVAAALHLGWQGWRASQRYGADERNPYAYLHTTADFMRLVRRVEDLSRLHPDGPRMLVAVVAGPYDQWPLPWYLRRMERVGYWPDASGIAAAAEAPVAIASLDYAPLVDVALGDRYVSEIYGLRPPDAFLAVSIERGLWERFLQARGVAGGGR